MPSRTDLNSPVTAPQRNAIEQVNPSGGVENSGWAGMSNGNGNINPFSGRGVVSNTAVNTLNRPRSMGAGNTLPPTDPAVNIPNANSVSGSGSMTPYGANIPTGANPYNPGGMNPNPTPVQQFQWAQGGGPNPGQLNAAAPDGPLSPEYANMQQNVQAGIQANSQKPKQYSIATNDPNIWMSPEGGTWMTPGYSPNNGQGINASQVYGTNPSLNIPMYNLPGGVYWQNPNEGGQSGALTQINSTQDAMRMLGTLPNRATGVDQNALLAGALTGIPIRTQQDYQQAGQVGQQMLGQTPTQAQQQTQELSAGNPTGQSIQDQLSGLTSRLSNPGSYTGANAAQDRAGDQRAVLSLVGRMLGIDPNMFSQLMLGSESTPNTQRTSPTGGGSTQTTGTGNQGQGTVNIGGQQMRWDPANQYYVPVNPVPYGQGGGEAS